MEDNEIGALFRLGRLNTAIFSGTLTISLLGSSGMILSALGYPLYAWVLYGLAGVMMFSVANTIERSTRTSVFIRSRQPIKQIEW